MRGWTVGIQFGYGSLASFGISAGSIAAIDDAISRSRVADECHGSRGVHAQSSLIRNLGRSTDTNQITSDGDRVEDGR